MLIRVLRAKIHRATVTDANVDYIGSITIDADLLDATGIVPGEFVLVSDLANGNRLDTYVFEGERGKGEITINGAAAHLVHPGDKVIILASAWMTPQEARAFRPTVVLVDETNRVVRKL